MDVILHADGSAELMHYGVKGMKWGVRRASRQLAKARTTEDRDAAIAKLEKHRTKGTAKLQKLEKKRVGLDRKLNKATMKDNLKSAKLEKKAVKLDKKAAKAKIRGEKHFAKSGKMYLTDFGKARNDVHRFKSARELDKHLKYSKKAKKLHTKASTLKANYDSAKAKVEANEAMQQAFKTQLRNIDQAYVNAGRKYLN